MSDAPRTPEEWASLLRNNWEERGRSTSRDFYIASHPGWDDDAAWAQQAAVDAGLFLHGLEDAWLAQADVLEVGCGVGRLAGPLGDRCRSYTGFDIAEPMVVEARERHAGRDDLRFFVGDGLGVPEAARDRRYRLALAVAVFIHCPPDVIGPLVRSAYDQLEPGGELRFQLRADPEDLEGMEAPPAAPTPEQVAHAEEVQAIEKTASPADMSLIEGRYYMGHAFRYREAREFLEGATGGEVQVLRFDPTHLYGWIKRI